MDILLVVIFIVLGIMFLLLEIFFLPGVTVGGIAGIVFVGIGVWYSFSQLGNLIGWLTLFIGVIVFGIAVWLFIRGKILDRMSLTTVLKSDEALPCESNVAVGDVGIAISRLAPRGTARFNDIEIEVKVNDQLVDAGCRIVIIDIVDKTPVVTVLNQLDKSI